MPKNLHNNILETIGNTPMVRLTRIPKGLIAADVYRAQDLLQDRAVAVKVYGPGIDPHAPERERIEKSA